jgi:hypothetical protein
VTETCAASEHAQCPRPLARNSRTRSEAPGFIDCGRGAGKGGGAEGRRGLAPEGRGCKGARARVLREEPKGRARGRRGDGRGDGRGGS